MILLNFVLAALISFYAHALDESKKQNRIEDLFVWKISEELKLSVFEEKQVSIIIKDLNQKKSNLNQKMQNLTAQMQAAKTNAEKSKLVSQYKTTLREFNNLSVSEVEKIEKAIGSTKAAQYLVVKMELTNKVKSLLANPEKEDEEAKPKIDKRLVTPKIIEEK